MLKLFEALATKPGTPIHVWYLTIKPQHSWASVQPTLTTISHVLTSVPISCSAEWQLQTRNPSIKVF